jgi:hypothetical protein
MIVIGFWPAIGQAPACDAGDHNNIAAPMNVALHRLAVVRDVFNLVERRLRLGLLV